LRSNLNEVIEVLIVVCAGDSRLHEFKSAWSNVGHTCKLPLKVAIKNMGMFQLLKLQF